MDEDRCEETPPLSLGNLGIVLRPERKQRRLIHTAPGQGHQDEDQDIHAEKDVREKRAAGRERLKKLDVIIWNHNRRRFRGSSGYRTESA